MKNNLKKILISLGLKEKTVTAVQEVGKWSVSRSLVENRLGSLVKKLREIVPDISNQESSEKAVFNDYWELKRRGLQAFQCSMMEKALNGLPSKKLTVVDIGDSAGTHMLYLKELSKGRFDINTISVNLDPRAIEKIKKRGLEAVLCRAENLDLGERQINLFTSFQMVEHLHNPAIFFRRLAKKYGNSKMVVTLPYLKNSRVGLHNVRNKSKEAIYAEDEHIFELSPKDWTLLMMHSGWRVVHSEIYYQYPRQWPVLSQLLTSYWRLTDFEGFWGAILEKDTTFSDNYRDWEN